MTDFYSHFENVFQIKVKIVSLQKGIPNLAYALSGVCGTGLGNGYG